MCGLVRGLEGSMEVSHVGGDGSGMELYRKTVRDQDGTTQDAWWFKLVPQGGQGGIETIPRRLARSLWPQEVCQQLTAVPPLLLIRQIAQQGAGGV